MSKLDVHPVADLFPMLADDELAELAADIKERGQLQPIVLDVDGRIIDGRNRLAACELAGVEPEFTTYDGHDPGGYALAVNLQRRNLTKSQVAVLAAKASKLEGFGSKAALARKSDVQASRISEALLVLEYEDLDRAVLSGAMALSEGYKTARERKTAADSTESQLARLRAEDPELADKVVEGELTLPGAWAERKARAEEEQRRRRVATHLLCESVVSVAQVVGTTNVIPYYDPAEALPGRTVTRQVIADAIAVLDQMAEAWKERDLA